MHRSHPPSRRRPASWHRWIAAVSRLGRPLAPTIGEPDDRRTRLLLFDDPLRCRPRILVVDDNPSHLWDTRGMLARYGVAPFVAGDGAQAVALACGQDFDLILMDLNMPVLDGLAATKQIRRYKHEHHTFRAPVVAYTSQLLTQICCATVV